MRKISFAAVLFVFATLALGGAACASPSAFQKRLTVNVPSKTWSGLTLFCIPGKIFVVDMNGKDVRIWNIPHSAHNVKPLPNGHILVEVDDIPGRPSLQEVDWSGACVWFYRMPTTIDCFWLDFSRLKNGNTLILSKKQGELFDRRVDDYVILEVDRNKNIVWQWSTVGHFSQLGLSQEAQGIIAGATQLTDIFQCNSMHELPPNRFEATDSRFKAGNILVSQRNTGLVFIIEKTTGNVVWNMQKTYGQHHVTMIPPGLPGAGNILIFDNGTDCGYPSMVRGYSEVLEMDPSTKTAVWTYQAPPDALETFYSRFRGSCQRLPNGNTLIAEAYFGRIFEVTSAGEIVWEFVNPYMRPGTTPPVNTIFRAYRVYSEWQYGGGTGPWSFSPFPW